MDFGRNTQGWAGSPVSKLFPLASLPASPLTKQPRAAQVRLQALCPKPEDVNIHERMGGNQCVLAAAGMNLAVTPAKLLNCPAHTELASLREQPAQTSVVASTLPRLPLRLHTVPEISV